MVRNKLACITGDIHRDLGLGPWNSSEPQFALAYTSIVDNYNVKCTLFASGLCVKRNKNIFKIINSFDCTEIGGHTYNSFNLFPKTLRNYEICWENNNNNINIHIPKLHHYIMSIIFDSFYGPHIYQKKDIKKTMKVLEEIDISPKVWRTHRYAGDSTTYSILEELGFIGVSDEFSDKFSCYQETGDLWHVTITPPRDEVIDPNSENSAYKRELFNSIESSNQRSEPIVLQMHPKRQAMMGYVPLTESIKKLKSFGYEFVSMSKLIQSIKN